MTFQLSTTWLIQKLYLVYNCSFTYPKNHMHPFSRGTMSFQEYVSHTAIRSDKERNGVALQGAAGIMTSTGTSRLRKTWAQISSPPGFSCGLGQITSSLWISAFSSMDWITLAEPLESSQEDYLNQPFERTLSHCLACSKPSVNAQFQVGKSHCGM